MTALSALVSGLDAELGRLGYKDSTLVWYRGCWRRMARFFAARGVEEFSLDVAMAWVDEACGGFFDKERAGTLKPTEIYLFRVAQMLGDYAVHGAVKLTLDHIDVAAITGFLDWLQASRRNSAATRNQRLAAVSSFHRWLQAQDPTRMARCQDILAIPAKRQPQPAVHHLTVEQTRRLLAQPDRSTRPGRRDATLLATLYDTAARVQELADLTVRDIRVEPPAVVAVTGKGGKTRHVPLTGNTVALLRAYLAEHRLDRPGHDDHPVFVNQHRGKLSRGGIAWIIRKYQTKTADPTLTDADISPHTLRHSKAMHLYEAGIPLPYIRDILGHVDLSTTEIYARASTEAKRRALEAAYTDIVTDDLPDWNHDPGLLAWLTNL